MGRFGLIGNSINVDCRGSSGERGQQPVDLLSGVVVRQADTHHAARAFRAEAFTQVDGVIVAVPNTNAGPRQALGRGARMLVLVTDGDGRHALSRAFLLPNSEKAHAIDGESFLDEVTDEFLLVEANGSHGGVELR